MHSGSQRTSLHSMQMFDRPTAAACSADIRMELHRSLHLARDFKLAALHGMILRYVVR